MFVTIIPDDSLVTVDGRTFTSINMAGFENIHAVQWYGDRGEVEFKAVGGVRPANALITSLDPFNGLVQQWSALRDAADAPPTLEQLKEIKRSEIRKDRDISIAGGVVFNNVAFDSDQRSRDNLTGAVAAFTAGVPLPANFVWRSADNQNIPMDMPSLVGLAATVVSHVNTQYAISWQRKAAVDAATTPAEVESA